MSEIPQFHPTESAQPKKTIENNIWKPSILRAHAADVAAAASTKDLLRTKLTALRILGDKGRFTRPLGERLGAGRVLAQLRDEINPSADLHHIVKTQLAHTGEVAIIDEAYVADLQKGNLEKKQIANTDGMITNIPGYPLYVSAADCYPVGIYDPENKAIGVFHTGVWGLLRRLNENGLRAMEKSYGTDPSKVKVVIAPGISDNFTVVKESLVTHQKNFPEFDLNKYIFETDNPLYVRFNLGLAIKDALVAQGVPEANIELSAYHTDTNNDTFPSERVEGNANRGSYGFMMALR